MARSPVDTVASGAVAVFAGYRGWILLGWQFHMHLLGGHARQGETAGNLQGGERFGFSHQHGALPMRGSSTAQRARRPVVLGQHLLLR